MKESMTGKRVIVAMSGGVDSSAALAILKEQGYDCVGVSMQLWDYSRKDLGGGGGGGGGEGGASREGSCCSLDDVNDARAVAEKLDVPFYVLNMEKVFSKEVVDYFVNAYLAGKTPNPCIKCNQALKFDVLLNKAAALEADFVATGHYARTEGGESPRLLKGVDRAKDQSYFLFTLTPEQMKRVLFPVGGLTKGEVREYARRLGLKTSDKEESQEICFVEEKNYSEFLLKRVKPRMGEIVGEDGTVIGSHSGLFNYTIGQRKGLHLSGGPFYVIGMDVDKNILMVGPEHCLFSNGLTASDLNWIDMDAKKRFEDGLPLEGLASKIRYRHPGKESSVMRTKDGKALVRFAVPERAVTPGQAVVFYRGEEVVGGGWIDGATEGA